MRKSISLFAFLLAIFCISAKSNAEDGSKKTRDNTFPVVRTISTPIFLSEDVAFSFLSEGGPRSYRLNGTLGFFADENNRFKFSAEELWERIHFDFSSGKTRRWLHQFAVGGKYLHLFECQDFFQGVQLGLSYSNAPGRKLSPKFLDDDSVDHRNIAGSWYWETEAGFTFVPWCNSDLFVGASYDSTFYRRAKKSSKRESGVGAIIDFNQKFYRNFSAHLKYEYKQIYNNIEASINWNKRFQCGDLGLGIFVNHLFGKRRLPCSTTYGVELSYAFGICECHMVPIGPCDYSDCDPCAYDLCQLASWVSTPAVYRPQVLAIADNDKCHLPTSSSISTQLVGSGDTFYLDVSPYFSSNGGGRFTYSASNLPAGTYIDPYTGVIEGVNHNTSGNVEIYNVTVTATDPCGSTSLTFSLHYEGVS